LAGGIPNGSTFPFKNITIDLKDGSSFKVDGKLLESALQYQPSPGYFNIFKPKKEVNILSPNQSDSHPWSSN
jgi:hypothetical protein